MIVFIDESGLSQRPTRVRTWAVKGESPVVQFRFNWDHISVIAGMHFAGVCFRLHDGSVKQEQVVEFLKALKAHYRRRLLILWDGGRPHRSRLVRDYVDSTEGHIQFAFLPLGQLLPRHAGRVAAYAANSNPHNGAPPSSRLAGLKLSCSDVTRLRKDQ